MNLSFDATSALRRKTVQRWILTLGLLALGAPGARLSAQVQTNYGPGGPVDDYRKGLIVLMQRSQALLDEIAAIHVRQTYCPFKERTDDGQRLQVAKQHLVELERAYADFKTGTEGKFDTGNILRQFMDAGLDPKVYDIWKDHKKEILDHPARDLDTKQKAWAVSRVDCNPPQRTAIAVQPPTASPRRNPLEGLTRPTLPPKRALPAVPPPFCTYRELWAWHDANIRPQVELYLDAGWDVMKYMQGVIDGVTRARDAGDAAGGRTLSGEIDWAEKAHGEMDANRQEWARFRDAMTVIDCTPPKEPEKPKAAIQTGFNWRFSTNIEYAGFPDFQKVAGTQTASTGVTGSTGTTGFGLTLGVDTRRFSCSLSGHQNSLSYEQTYNPPEINFARMSTGTVDGRFFDAACGPRWHKGIFGFGAFLGGTFAQNKLTLTDSFSNGQTVRSTRNLTDFKSNVAFEFDIPIRNRFGLRFEVVHTAGGLSGDADRNFRFGAGLQFGGDFHRF